MPRGPAQERKKQARSAARFVRERLGLGDKAFDAAVLLGAGWPHAPELDKIYDSVPVRKIPGFEHWEEPDAEPRLLSAGKLGERRVIILPEPVTLNYDLDYPASTRQLVRLQVEFLAHLDVSTLLLTGSATPLKGFSDGDVAVVKSFLTVFAAPRPLYGSERVDPASALDPKLRKLALAQSAGKDHRVREACYAVLPGPDVESEEDRALLALAGAHVVGTHGLAEASVAALCGVKLLMMTVVNTREPETDEIRPHKDAKTLGEFLGNVITHLA